VNRAPGFGLVLIATTAIAIAAAGPVHAGPYSTVPSAADPGDPIDVHFHLDYRFEIERSTIRRERVGQATSPTDPIPEVKDLLFRGSRHELVPTLELGVFHDLWLSMRLPIVIRQTRDVLYDQRSTPCSFVEPGATCINSTNSSTVIDGLLPPGGFDAGDPAGFPVDDDNVFRGPSRKGLDRIYLGAGIAPMNQKRDDTKPTWKINVELAIPVAKPARLDRDAPGNQTSVGTGVYALRVSTSIAKRIGWAEPFFALHWDAPLKAKSDSPFADPGFGARNTLPQQQAGVHFGFEAIIVDRPLDSTRVGLELSSIINAHFEGRAYTPMWEVFAYAGDVRHGGPLVIDEDPTVGGMQAISHPGVTDVENYLELGATAAVRAEIGKTVHLAAMASLTTATQHVITFDDAGVDRPTCSSTQTTGCETDSNDLVNPGTAEVNPLHTPLIDLVGHRYVADDNLAISLGVQAMILF
jgi:hypothetical protein